MLLKHIRDYANYRLPQETSGLLWARNAAPKLFWINSFRLVTTLHSVQVRRELSWMFQAQRKRLTCIIRLYMALLLSAPTMLH
jgi:hypothetical protein